MSRPITQSRSRTRSAQTVCLSMMALMALGLLLIGPVAVPAQAQERAPLIVGVTNLGQAVAALRAQGVPVRHVIDVSSAVAVVGDASRLRGLPFVRYVEPDPPDAVWIVQDSLPYGVANIDAEVVWGGSQGATDVIAGQGGWGIKVAVIDTGVDCSHADLVGGCAYGANFVNAALALDDHGHGTHVAGTIGARDNGQGVIGVAPEVELYAVKVLDANGSGSWSAVAAGINWAVQNGMNVISMSLGGTAGSQAVADAVAAADAAGILVVSAAGNSGCCNTVLYPAKYPESMAVAAVDQLDQWASFSSTGPEVDVAAPGVSISSTVPTVFCALCDPSGYRNLSGTSMATPHVSGVAALLMSRGRSNAEARALITSTAVDLGTGGVDNYYGWGRVDAVAAVGGSPAPPPVEEDPPPPPEDPPPPPEEDPPPPPAEEDPPPPPDTTAPTTAITSPSDGATIARRAWVTIQASASDDQGIVRVDFYVKSSLKCSATAAPYACNWKVPGARGKRYNLQSVAYDAAGNVAHSAVVTVTGQ